jgi:predicted peroxiredoxin
MSESKPYFANTPKQFPQRTPLPKPQPTEELDNQLICECGCEIRKCEKARHIRSIKHNNLLEKLKINI